MSNRPFEPMERATAQKVESVLRELAKDCDELAVEAARGNMVGVRHGISKARELSEALKSLDRLLSGR